MSRPSRKYIKFIERPPMKLQRDFRHLWIRWNHIFEYLFTENKLTKLRIKTVHPFVQRMQEFLGKFCPEEVGKTTSLT